MDINGDTPFELLGTWWLQGKREHAVPGNLRFDPDDGASLSIIGSLHSPFDEGKVTHNSETGETSVVVSSQTRREAERYPRIFGEIGGTRYTLQDCFVASSRGIGFGNSSEVIRVNIILKGEHLESIDMQGISVAMDYLPQWIDIDGFERSEQFHAIETDAPRKVVAEYGFKIRERGHQRISMTDGSSVGIAHRAGTAGDEGLTKILRQYYWFTARYESPRDIQELVDIASDMQDLVSIGTGRIAAFHGVTVARDDVRQLSLANTDHGELPVNYLVEWTVKDTSDKPGELANHEMYFTLSDIGGIGGIKSWLEAAAKFRSPLGRVMSSRYERSMFTSDKLLNRAVALEAFYNLATGLEGKNFRDRISGCIDNALPKFSYLIDSNVEDWLTAITRSRNDIAHFKQKIRNGTPTHQHFLSESLYWLFVFCMLKASDMPENLGERVMDHQHMTWLKRNIKDAVAASI